MPEPEIIYTQEPGGLCPVQAEGTINGHPFYFRSRGSIWAVYIAEPGCDPSEWQKACWYHWEEYPGSSITKSRRSCTAISAIFLPATPTPRNPSASSKNQPGYGLHGWRNPNPKSNLMPDPAIKPVLAEIKAILKKHDLAGIVFITSRTHTEFLYQIDPSWSCITEEPDGVRLRAKGKAAETVEALRLSVGLIAGFADAMRNGAATLDGLLERLGASGVDFSHFSRRETPEEKP